LPANKVTEIAVKLRGLAAGLRLWTQVLAI
jgi:hypothetical protein